MSANRSAVIGAGAWGTALAHVLACNGGEVALWSFEPEVADEINNLRENRTYLPGCPLSGSIRATSDLAEAVSGANLVVSVSPSQTVRGVMAKAAPFLTEEAIIVSASKGMEIGTHLLMSQVLAEVLPANFHSRIAALSGPSFAVEVAKSMPTAVSVAASDREVAEAVQQAFNCRFFRTYWQEDVIGVETGGALKNVIALAAGIADGLGFGHNSRAALITRGIAEIGRLGAKMGARPITFLGLSGIGDLVLTCTGELSRNRTVGVRLGQGEKLGDILSSMRAVAEGVKTCGAANELAERFGVEMPISAKVGEILNQGKDPREAVAELMGRPMKHEFWELT